MVSGYNMSYSPEMINKLEIISKNPITKLVRKIFYKEDNNVQFNEACVEIFSNQYEKFEQYEGEIAQIYTNIKSGYFYNANLVRQMLLAKGIPEKEMFEGLFNYRKANGLIGKFNKKTFRKISKGMDEIFELLNKKNDTWNELDDKIEELDIPDEILKEAIEENPELRKFKSDILRYRNITKNKISEMEELIIDKILIPSLQGMNEDKKQNILKEYAKFVMLSMEYLQEKTGIKITDENPGDDKEKIMKKLSAEQNSENYKVNDIQNMANTKEINEQER